MNKKAKNKSVPCFDMQFITSSISTTLVLLLLGLVVFFVLGAHNLSVYVKENINFSILISDDMKESDILKLQKKLDKEPFVKETEYISKKQALREQTEAMGTDPQEFLGYNPITASIEIKLHSGYANSDSIAKIEKKIRKNTDIQEVLYQKDLIDAVNENIRNISLMLLGLAVILTFISFALINNTIRLTIYSKRFLIHTMKLVGASWGFIRRPFRIVGCHCRCHFVGSRLLAGFLRTGTDQGYHSGGDAAGVCFRTGVRSAYYLVVCIAFHQQISENEGKHPVLHITLLSERQSFR